MGLPASDAKATTLLPGIRDAHAVSAPAATARIPVSMNSLCFISGLAAWGGSRQARVEAKPEEVYRGGVSEAGCSVSENKAGVSTMFGSAKSCPLPPTPLKPGF